MLISRTYHYYILCLPLFVLPILQIHQNSTQKNQKWLLSSFFLFILFKRPSLSLTYTCFLSGNIITTATSVWKYMRRHQTLSYPLLYSFLPSIMFCYFLFPLYFPSNNSSWYNNEGVCVFIAEAHFSSNSTFLKSRYFDSKPIALTPL